MHTHMPSPSAHAHAHMPCLMHASRNDYLGPTLRSPPSAREAVHSHSPALYMQLHTSRTLRLCACAASRRLPRGKASSATFSTLTATTAMPARLRTFRACPASRGATRLWCWTTPSSTRLRRPGRRRSSPRSSLRTIDPLGPRSKPRRAGRRSSIQRNGSLAVTGTPRVQGLLYLAPILALSLGRESNELRRLAR